MDSSVGLYMRRLRKCGAGRGLKVSFMEVGSIHVCKLLFNHDIEVLEL